MVVAPPVRVLVVDDSLVVRKVLSEVLPSHPRIELAGTAATGEIALTKIRELKPDVVTLDIEMPGMGGLKALTEIRKLYPKLPVIMFSTLTERGAAATVEALALGASDYATKPQQDGLQGARLHIERELIGKILALKPAVALHAPPASPPSALRPIQRRIDIVAIGSSTGGPSALMEVIPHLPRDLAVPVVIVQHMPALFTKLMAERLNSRSALPVREGCSGTRLESGHIWIAPGDFHMTVSRKGPDIVLEISQGPAENSCRPAVDPMFRSVANLYGPHALGIVMTGMGADGARGAKAIHDAGGEVLVQDEATSVVWGMPGAVVAAGVTNQIYPVDRIAEEITRRVRSRRWLVSTPPNLAPK